MMRHRDSAIDRTASCRFAATQFEDRRGDCHAAIRCSLMLLCPLLLWLIGLPSPTLADSLASPAAAEASDSSDAIGRSALESLGNVPWFDRDEDRVIAVPVEETDAADDDVAARTVGYEAAKKPNTQGTGNYQSVLEMIGQVISWSILAVLVLLIVAAIAYAFMLHERDRAPRRGAAAERGDRESETAERLQRLPVQIDQPASNLLSEARRLMEAGRYNEAIVYLFSHELVQLDRHQLLRLARGKTNRQYLREIRQSYDLQEILHNTIHAFEDAFFGDHTLTRQRFQSCWEQLDRFHAAVEQTAGKGASV
ncbi:DUF4129 domain-containing protein [Rosistilla oblonga]|uniref:DUF4129 domain-containing protein n=1 Tax=Rosistilla oblonga TaxID=2527990 RepID=UPI003A97ACB0